MVTKFKIVWTLDNHVVTAGRIFTHEIEARRNCKEMNKRARLISFPGSFSYEPYQEAP